MHKKTIISLLSLGTFLLPPCAKADFYSNTCQGRYTISGFVGMAPNIYVDREQANAAPQNTANPFAPPAFQLIDIPTFQDQFKMPFILQGELGYFVRNDWEVFYDFDWTHSKGKTHSYSHKNTNGVVDVSGSQKFSNFNGYGNYLGTRFYLTFAPFSIKPFAGFKIGIMSRSAVKAKEVSRSGRATFNDNITYFKQDTTISGGFQLGLDWQLTQNLSCLFKAEIIGTGERKSGIVFNHPPHPVLKAGNATVQLSIPISIGLKWTI